MARTIAGASGGCQGRASGTRCVIDGCVVPAPWLSSVARPGNRRLPPRPTLLAGGSFFMRIRHAAVPAVLLFALAWRVPAASAAAEVHRFNIVFSAIPTSISATDFNNVIGGINQTALEPRGLEPLKKIKFSWLFDTEMRYFVRQNVAVSFGVGQLKAKTVQTYLPGIGQSIDIQA